MKKMKKILSIICSIIFFCTSLSLIATAETGNSYFKIEGPATVSEGVEFEAAVYATKSNMYGASGTLKYDPDACEIVSIDSDLRGSWELETNNIAEDGKIYFACNDDKAKTPTTANFPLFTLTLKIKNISGDTTLALENLVVTDGKDYSSKKIKWTASTSEDDDGYDDSTNEETEDVNDPNNFFLKSLIVKNADISPAFNRDIKVYTATVPFEIDHIELEAIPESDKARVEISNTELNYIGKNIVKVVVYSESGLKRTYRINVIRQDRVKEKTTESSATFNYLWLIIAAAVLLLAIIATVIIILIKKKKKQQAT